jgi:hypothetical protein
VVAVAAARAAAGSASPAPDPQQLALAIREACRQALAEAHEEALSAGLCGEGAWEAALGALSRLSAAELLARAARSPPRRDPAP